MSLLDKIGVLASETAPAFEITANGININDKLTSDGDGALISLTLTDNKGFVADTLTMVLDDSGGTLALPPMGAIITLKLGMGKTLVDKGTYTVDEHSHSGPPDVLTIVARSADFSEGFKAQRTYAWHATTLGEIITTLASYYNLVAAVSDALAAVAIEHIDQTDESDAAFMTRLGKQYNAIATIKNGRLLFLTAGAGKTSSGKALPLVTIKRSEGDTHRYNAAERVGKYSGVQARWLDTDTAQVVYVIAGENGTLKTITKTYRTQPEAWNAANAEWQRINRNAASFTLTSPVGLLALVPDQPVVLEGYKPAIDAMQWQVASLVHSLVGALTTEVVLESAAQL